MSRAASLHQINGGFWRQLQGHKAQATPLLHEGAYVFEGDDVGVLAVPQEDLNLFRGVPFTLIDDLKQTEVDVRLPAGACGWDPFCPSSPPAQAQPR